MYLARERGLHVPSQGEGLHVYLARREGLYMYLARREGLYLYLARGEGSTCT